MNIGQRGMVAGGSAGLGWVAVQHGAAVAAKTVEAGKAAVAFAPVACTSVIGFGHKVVATAFVQKGIEIAATCGKAIASTTVAQKIGAAGYTAGSFVATKTIAAGNWVVSTSVAQKTIAFSTQKAFPFIVSSADSALKNTVAFGENFTALSNITPLHGILFTGAVSLLGTGFDRILQGTKEYPTCRREAFFRKHTFVSLTLGHAISGAVVYGASVGLAAAGVTTAAITVPGALVLTATALTAAVVVKVAIKTISCCYSKKKKMPSIAYDSYEVKEMERKQLGRNLRGKIA